MYSRPPCCITVKMDCTILLELHVSFCVLSSCLCLCLCVHQQLVSSAREKKPRGRYAKLEEEMERGNQDFIEQQRNQQQVRECLSLFVCVCVGGGGLEH